MKGVCSFIGRLILSLSILLTVGGLNHSFAQSEETTLSDFKVDQNEVHFSQSRFSLMMEKIRIWKLGENLRLRIDTKYRPSQEAMPYSQAFVDNTEVGSDGYFITKEFHYYTSLIAHGLLSIPEIERRQIHPRLDQIGRSMNSLQNLESLLLTKKKIFLEGVEKSALNDFQSGIILIHVDDWKKASAKQKVILVLHEFFGLSKIPDDHYQTSSEVMRVFQKKNIFKKFPTLLLKEEMPKYEIMPMDLSGKYSHRKLFGDHMQEQNRTLLVEGKSYKCSSERLGFLNIDESVKDRKSHLSLTFAITCYVPSLKKTFFISALKHTDDEQKFELHGTQLIRNGIQYGWYSGAQIFLKTSQYDLTVQYDPTFLGLNYHAIKVRIKSQHFLYESTMYVNTGAWIIDHNLLQDELSLENNNQIENLLR